MKLLLCPECSSLIQMGIAKRTCSCGASSGMYTDHLKAEVWGEAIVVGIDNYHLRKCILMHDAEPKDNLSLAAWIMGNPAKNVVYHKGKT